MIKVWKGLAEGLKLRLRFYGDLYVAFHGATKQPAMTAARFAEAVEKNPQGKNIKI